MPPKKEEKKAEEVKKVVKKLVISLKPEQNFHDKAKPASEAIKKELDALVPPRAYWLEPEAHKFFEGAFDCDILPEVWTPEIWEKLPKMKIEGVPEGTAVDPKVSYQFALDRAIKLGCCYPYLRTALEKPFDKAEQPETSLTDFFKNDYLSDVTLVHPQTGATYKCHRIIVASGSTYFCQLFRKYKTTAEFPSIKVPLAHNQSYENSSDDQIIRILKYIYNSQDLYKIKNEINIENIFNLYAQAHAMGCTKLLSDLTDLIITELITHENVAHFYQDALEFQNYKLADACEKIIVKKFAECMESSIEFLNTLPFEQFNLLLQSDDLEIPNEYSLVDLIKKYLERHANAQYREPVHPEKVINETIWNALSVTERTARAKEYDTAVKAVTTKKTAKMTAQCEEFAKLKPFERLQFMEDMHHDDNLEVIKGRLHINPVTDAEKLTLFKSIRWAFMTHEQLVAVSRMPEFALAKDMILSALSCRLDCYDTVKKDMLDFSVKPRTQYCIGQKEDATVVSEVQKLGDNPQLLQSTLNAQVTGKPGSIVKSVPKINQPHQQPDTMPAFKSNPHIKRGEYANEYQKKFGDERNRLSQIPSKKMVQTNVHAPVQMTMTQEPTMMAFGRTDPSPERPSGPNPNMQPVMGEQKRFTQSMKPMVEPYVTQTQSQASAFHQQAEQISGQVERPSEFVYNYDMDENGALYFLGSFGKKRVWQNPHSVAQVQSFASTVGAGEVQDFVGRTTTNCRTHNEPFSYYGVDLGKDRAVLPTCYTIRNRNSTTHVMLNWHFEASNDMVNWTLLDRRIFQSGDADWDNQFEMDRKDLCHKGATSTWGIDTDLYRELGFGGFRYFRVIQVGKNSSGSDNLALSGFELYGRVIKGRWP